MSDRPKRVYVNGSEIRPFRDLEADNARLRAKCNRLQAFAEQAWSGEISGEMFEMLHPGDMDPEPDPEGGK